MPIIICGQVHSIRFQNSGLLFLTNQQFKFRRRKWHSLDLVVEALGYECNSLGLNCDDDATGSPGLDDELEVILESPSTSA